MSTFRRLSCRRGTLGDAQSMREPIVVNALVLAHLVKNPDVQKIGQCLPASDEKT
jgi:hypothetical protein